MRFKTFLFYSQRKTNVGKKVPTDIKVTGNRG